MASNAIPDALPQLFALAHDAADGASVHGIAIGLVHNTAANINAALVAAQTAEVTYAAAKTAKNTASTNLRVSDSNARAFIKACGAYFTQVISDGWTAAWEATGFPNQSTGVPSTQDERMSLLPALRDYFTANPTLEISNGSLVLTAAHADALYSDFADTRDTMNE